MNAIELENWLTEEGDRIMRKAVNDGMGTLNKRERLIYEVWLLDTEQRNGGISQYFCNRGIKQWHSLSQAASESSPSFTSFVLLVNQVVSSSADPYKAILSSPFDFDSHYLKHREQILGELRS